MDSFLKSFRKVFSKDSVQDQAPTADRDAKVDAGVKRNPTTSGKQPIKEARDDVYRNGDGGALLYRQLQSKAESFRSSHQERALEDIAAVSVAKAPIVTSPTSKEATFAIQQQSDRVRQKRLMKELKEIQKSSLLKTGAVTIDLAEDNLFEWDVKLFKLDPDSLLAKDLAHLATMQGIDNIWIRISFPNNFPFAPPFVRVLAPLVQGGFVVSGGAVCMELLTPDGWSQAYTVEAVIVQTIATMVKGESRIVASVARDFSEREAREAYEYLVKSHAKYGWENPPAHDG